MPELPEVETIRLGLQKFLLGHTMQSVTIHLPKSFVGDSTAIQGAKVTAIRRYGKGLLIDLSNNYSIAIHVKMTGQLIYRSAKEAYDPTRVPRLKLTKSEIGELPDVYTHVIFHLDNDAVLYYRDIRQFGWIKIVKTSEAMELPFFKSLGVEPLTDLSLDKFQKLLAVKTPIKLVLMDQTKIAGIGNIYANDSLFLAKIHPSRPANSLTKAEVKRLHKAVIELLQKSINVGGASASNYVNVLGEKGTYQDHFLVYKKDGKPCPICGAEIKRMKLGGRGTFICPNCQI